MTRALLCIGWVVVLVACGGTPSRGSTLPGEETRIRSTAGGVEVYSASTLFDEGNRAVRDGQCLRAVEHYDLLVREFDDSRYVSAALYNAGLCLLGERLHGEAAVRFERLVTLRPDSPDVVHARLQMAEALEHVERWEAALTNAEALLARGELDAADRLEAMARRARALLGLERRSDAADAARQATTYYRTRRGDQVIADEAFAAMSAFVLAETIRLESETVVLPEADELTQHAALERRAQLLLQAQNAYFDAVRYTDPHWAAAAGYRIGSMYRDFFDAITHAPVPPPHEPLSAELLEVHRATFRQTLRERVRPLLRHAIRYWELTLTMVERTRVDSEWTARVHADLDAVRALLAAETATTPSEPEPSETAPGSGRPPS